MHTGCVLPPTLLAEWPGSFMCCCANVGVEQITEIRVSRESWHWRIKFSCHSYQVSNQQPFNHKSGAQLTQCAVEPLFKEMVHTGIKFVGISSRDCEQDYSSQFQNFSKTWRSFSQTELLSRAKYKNVNSACAILRTVTHCLLQIIILIRSEPGLGVIRS